MEAQEWLQSAKQYETGLEILRNAKGESIVWRLLAKGKRFYNCQRLEQEILALVQPVGQKPAPEKPEITRAAEPASTPTIYLDALIPAYQQQRRLYAQVNHLYPLLDATYDPDRKKAFEIKLALQNA